MNRRKLINFIEFLINSYEGGISTGNIVKNLLNSPTYGNIGKLIEKDVLVDRVPLYLALRKSGAVPLDFSYVLEAAEKSGNFIQILESYLKTLDYLEKIDNELKVYKGYLFMLNFLLIFGVGVFYFIFSNVVLKVAEDRSGQIWKIIEFVYSLLSPVNVLLFIFFVVLIGIFLSFRNPVLDLFEYYILGRPYREIAFSGLMNIWGNLISAGLPLAIALYVATLTLQNNYIKSLLVSYFSKITDNYTLVNKEAMDKILSVFPRDYQSILKSSFESGVFDKELIKLSEKIFGKSSEDLKRKIFGILIFLVVIGMILVGGLIVVSFMSIYLPLFQDLN